MVRFDWEEAVAQDLDLQRIDAFVKLTISKFPGQPTPRADTNRGSRYEPAAPSVKAEQPSTATMIATSRPMSMQDSGTTGGSTPQYINIRDYLSESSSEVDTREVNPMDELSDFEPDTLNPQKSRALDVEIDEGLMETSCEVCKKSDREDEIILCDDCNAEYHFFCLQLPLQKVPDEAWYCPKCSVKHPVASIKPELPQAEMEATDGGTPSTTTLNTDNGSTSTDPAAISIAQTLEQDPEKSNLLLIHACNCDDIKCTHPELHVFCPHMKRFLRSVCWASHSTKWRSYRLAWLTAELFAYHAMSCSLPQCNVPLCVKIREEEIV